MYTYTLKGFGCIKTSTEKDIFYLSNTDRRFPINVGYIFTAACSIPGVCLSWYEIFIHIVLDRPGNYFESI
jgi:hypothetical protein